MVDPALAVVASVIEMRSLCANGSVSGGRGFPLLPPPPSLWCTARLNPAGYLVRQPEWADRAAMAVVFTAIRVILGFFFAFSGVLKLTDQILAEVYQQMKSQFVQFADVFPLKDIGFKPDPYQYLQAVGWVELVAGILLAFGPQILQEISNFVLCVIMIGAIYTLLVLKEPIAMCTPAAVCLGLLLLLNIRGQGKRSKSKSA